MIEREYLPATEEIERARATVERLETGVGALGSGDFVDAAMLGAARQILAIAERYGLGGGKLPRAEIRARATSK